MNPSITEITTGATDAVIGIIGIICVMGLWRIRSAQPFKAHVWIGAFVSLIVASILGAIAHGFLLPDKVLNWLWQPLYFSLGMMLGLIAVGAVIDGWSEAAGRRALPIAVVMSIVFYGITVIAKGAFLVFVAYEVAAMLFALVVYTKRAIAKAPGAMLLAGAVFVTLIAGVVQQTKLSATIIWPFDQNGLFHLIQMPALVLYYAGVRAGLKAERARSG